MADSNTPEHQDRGLFGLFGKKKEEETHQQHGTAVEGHVVGVAPHEEGHVGESHPTPVSHGQVGVGEPYAAYGHVGEIHPAPVSHGHVGEIHPAPVSHGHVGEGKFHGEVGEKKQEGGIMGKLHRSNSSSSSSSSDEEEDEKGEKKKKGGLRDKLKLRGRKKEGEEQGHVKAEEEGGEKKGLVEKIKEKIPGHHKEGE